MAIIIFFKKKYFAWDFSRPLKFLSGVGCVDIKGRLFQRDAILRALAGPPRLPPPPAATPHPASPTSPLPHPTSFLLDHLALGYLAPPRLAQALTPANRPWPTSPPLAPVTLLCPWPTCHEPVGAVPALPPPFPLPPSPPRAWQLCQATGTVVGHCIFFVIFLFCHL